MTTVEDPDGAGVLVEYADAVRILDTREQTEEPCALRALLAGEPGAYRDAVLLNAAAALTVAGHAGDLRAGARMAAEAIDSGAARAKLQALAKVTGAPEA